MSPGVLFGLLCAIIAAKYIPISSCRSMVQFLNIIYNKPRDYNQRFKISDTGILKPKIRLGLMFGSNAKTELNKAQSFAQNSHNLFIFIYSSIRIPEYRKLR